MVFLHYGLIDFEKVSIELSHDLPMFDVQTMGFVIGSFNYLYLTCFNSKNDRLESVKLIVQG